MGRFGWSCLDCPNETNNFLVSKGVIIMSECTVYHGLGVSRGRFEGKAKVLRNTGDFDKVSNGDIIIVFSSSPAWTVPLLKASALVAEVGGILCHTAIIAREIGVPGVVNIDNITSIVHDGDRVIVNGDTGEVSVYSN